MRRNRFLNNKLMARHRFFLKGRIFLFFTTLFLLAGVGMLFFLRPSYSQLEKRKLETVASPSVHTLWNGQFFDQVSTWYGDTYPLREMLLTANAKLETLHGIQAQQIHGTVAVGDAIPDAFDPDAGGTGQGENPQGVSEEEGTGEEKEQTLEGQSGSDTREESQKETQSDKETKTEKDTKKEKETKDEKETEKEKETPADGTIHTVPETVGATYITGDRAFSIFYFNLDSANQYVSLINRVTKKLAGTATVYDILAPTSAGICLDEKVQESLHSSNQEDAFNYIYSGIKDDTKKVSVFDLLKEHNSEYIYFNTDHHWTALGAYYAYTQFCREKGIEPHELDSFKTKTFPGFLGTYYASSNQAAILEKNPDTITAYVPQGTNKLTYTDMNGKEIPWYVINDVSDYQANSKYSCFIAGDTPYGVIKNPKIKDGSSCVVVKESYGNAFVPFLVDHYQTVHIIDYRYNQENLVEFVEKHKVQDVIYLNNADAINSSEVMTTLGNMIP